MNVFFCPDIKGNIAVLSNDESSHCIRVLRKQKGDVVQLIDGKGGFYKACLTDDDARQCRLEITEVFKPFKSRDFSLHIAIAPTKSTDRFEWFIEKAVEIGVDQITLLLCDHSERRVYKTERLKKLIVSTMKQAVVPRIPQLNELKPYIEFVKKPVPLKTTKMVAYCDDKDRKSINDIYHPGENAVILIGPEGDFSPQETELALNNGFIPVTLGENRLRTETAGIVACHTINFLNGK